MFINQLITGGAHPVPNILEILGDDHNYGHSWIVYDYPLVNVYSLLLKMAMENSLICILTMVIFHSYSYIWFISQLATGGAHPV